MTEPQSEYEELPLDEEAGAEADVPARTRSSPGDIVISARLAGIAGTIFGVACLTALAIVAAVQGANGLSTIALALAILAFVIQILVFIAQANSSNHQMLRSEQLNTQTRALLTEMQATARSTHDMVGEQFGQLLRAFMDAAKSAQGKGGFNQEAFERKFMENFRRESTPKPRVGPASARGRGSTRPQPEVQRYDSGPFPPREEVDSILSDMSSLSSKLRKRLQEYGYDKHLFEKGDRSYEGFPPSFDEQDAELANQGWLSLVRVGPDDPPKSGLVYQLTDKGKLAERVLNASGAVPEWARNIVV